MLVIMLVAIGIGIYSLLSAIIITCDDTDWIEDHPVIILLLQPGFLLFCFFVAVSVILVDLFSRLGWVKEGRCERQKEEISTEISPIGRDFARKVTEIHGPAPSSKNPEGV